MPKLRKESKDTPRRKSSHDLAYNKSRDNQIQPASLIKSITTPFLVGVGKALPSSLKCYIGQSKTKSPSKRKIVKSKKNLACRDDSKVSAPREASTKKLTVYKKIKKHRKFRPMDTLRDDWAAYSKLKGCSKISFDTKKVKKTRKASLIQINKEESSRVSFFSTMMNFKAFTITKNTEEVTQVSDTFQSMVADFDKQFLQGLQNAGQKFKFRLSREPQVHHKNHERPFFDSHNDDWNTFSTILKAFLNVNNTPKKRWNKVLLNCLDTPTYRFLKGLCQPELVNKMTFEELFDILDNHFLSTSEEDIIRVFSKEKYASKMMTLEQSRKTDSASLDHNVRKKILWSEQELKKNHWINDNPTDRRSNGKSFLDDRNEPGIIKSNKNQNEVKKTTKTKLPIVKSLESTATPADGRDVIKKVPAVTGILIDKEKESVKCRNKSTKCQNHDNPSSPRKSVRFDPKLERTQPGKRYRTRNEIRSRKPPGNRSPIKTPDETCLDKSADQSLPSKISEPSEASKISDQANTGSIGEQNWGEISDQISTINKTEDIHFSEQGRPNTETDTSEEKNILNPLLDQVDTSSLPNTQSEQKTEEITELNSTNKGQYLRDIKEKIFAELNNKTNDILMPFNKKTERWDVFKEQLNTHLALKRVPYEKWVQFLISTLDNDTQQILNKLTSPSPPEEKKFTDVMVMLDEYFNTIANKCADKKSQKSKVCVTRSKTRNTGVLIFYYKHGDWKEFKPKIEKHMVDTGLPKSQWAVELLSRLDNKTYKILTHICEPNPPYRKTYEELVEIFDKESIFVSKDSKEKKRYIKKIEDQKLKTEVMSNDAKIMFNRSSGTWDGFKTKLKSYLEGKSIEKGKWTFELLSRLDPHTYSMVKEKCFTTTPLQMSFESLIEIIDNHFESAKAPEAPKAVEVKNDIPTNHRFGSSGDWLSLKKAATNPPNKKVDRWTFALLCGLDCKSYQILEEACAPQLPEDKRFEELVEILDKYVLSMPSKSGPSIAVKEVKEQDTAVQTAPEIPPENVNPKDSNQNVLENKPAHKKKKHGKRTDSLWTLALLNGLNDKVHHLLNALCEPELPNKKSFEEIVDLLDKFLIPMPLKKKNKLKQKCSIGNDNTKFFHYSRIPPFDSKHGDWKTYRKSLTVNFELFDIPKDKWSLAFLSKLDDSVFRKLQTICDPVPPYKKSFQDLLAIVDGLFITKIEDKSDAFSELSWISSTSQPPSLASKSKAEDWTTFKEDLKTTLESCKMAKDKWVGILLKSVDSETYKLLQDLCRPIPPEQKTFEELMSVIDHHFLPPPKPQEDDFISTGERINVFHCQQLLSPDTEKLKDRLYQQTKQYKIINSKEIYQIKKPHVNAEKPFEESAIWKKEQTDLLKGEEIKICNFDPKEESWFVFKQRLIRDLDIVKHPKELWNEVLVQKLDSGTLQILREASKPSRLEHKTFDELASVLDGYFVPAKDVSSLAILGQLENKKLPSPNQISSFASKIKHWTGYRQRVQENFHALGIPEKVTSELVKGLDDVIYELLQSLCEAQYNLMPFKDLCSIFNKEDAQVQTEKTTGLQNYPSFDFMTGDWKVYKERLTNHLVLYDTPVEKWSYALLSVLSTKDYETLKKLCQPQLPEEKTLKELINILDGFFIVNKKNKSEFIKQCLKKEQDCLIAFKNKLKEDVQMLTKLPSQYSLSEQSKLGQIQMNEGDQELVHLKNYLQKEITHVGANILKDRSKRKIIRKWKL